MAREFIFFLVGLVSLTTLASTKTYNLDSKGLAAHGYDVVAYLEKKSAVAGNPKITAEYDGAKWAFISETDQKKFMAEPAKYIPAYGGYCAWAMVDGEKVDVDPESFKIIDGKTYLFYNGLLANTLKKWNKKNDDAGLKSKADANWQKVIGN